MHDFEKLGAFYLGKRYDMEAQTLTDELVNQPPMQAPAYAFVTLAFSS